MQILFMSGLEFYNKQVCDTDEHGLSAHGQAIASKLGKGRESEASQDTGSGSAGTIIGGSEIGRWLLLVKCPSRTLCCLQQGSQQELRVGAARI